MTIPAAYSDIRRTMIEVARTGWPEGYTAAEMKRLTKARIPAASNDSLLRAARSLIQNGELQKVRDKPRAYAAPIPSPEATERRIFRPLKPLFRDGPNAHRKDPEWY